MKFDVKMTLDEYEEIKSIQEKLEEENKELKNEIKKLKELSDEIVINDELKDLAVTFFKENSVDSISYLKEIGENLDSSLLNLLIKIFELTKKDFLVQCTDCQGWFFKNQVVYCKECGKAFCKNDCAERILLNCVCDWCREDEED